MSTIWYNRRYFDHCSGLRCASPAGHPTTLSNIGGPAATRRPGLGSTRYGMPSRVRLCVMVQPLCQDCHGERVLHAMGSGMSLFVTVEPVQGETQAWLVFGAPPIIMDDMRGDSCPLV